MKNVNSFVFGFVIGIACTAAIFAIVAVYQYEIKRSYEIGVSNCIEQYDMSTFQEFDAWAVDRR